MTVLDEIPKRCSPEVVIGPVDDEGQHVVKHRGKRTYLKLGPQESFLLRQFDGKRTFGSIVSSFEERFGEPITFEDVQGFAVLADGEGLLERTRRSSESEQRTGEQPHWFTAFYRKCLAEARRQSLLYFRITLFDPDRCLNWLEPKTRWLFSSSLFIASLVCGSFALVLMWANWTELVTQFSSQLGWETFVLAWFTTIAVTICHEFGHGLACKRYGGEVHEMGALWIFFTPCLFCNVSDAWLLPSRWQRLLISLAGTYVDLLIWIIAVFTWRLTAQETAVNYMAWIIVSTCGIRVAFNVNPLLRLDGYYALADFLGIHNLRRRSRQRWMEYVRWALWGATWPAAIKDGRALLIYGVISWTFTVGFLNVLFFSVAQWLHSAVGVVGLIAGTAVFIKVSKRYFQGSLGEDFKMMFQYRTKRVYFWGAAVIALLAVPMYDRAGGPFQVRPVVRWEVRAPVAGFLREVRVDEGQVIASQGVLGRIEIPELASQISRKESEINEVEANLRRLEAGPRKEEVAELRERVKRAESWRNLGEHDLQCARQAMVEAISQLDLRIQQAGNELQYCKSVFAQAQQLYEKGGLAGQQLLVHKKRVQEAESEMQQAEAQKRIRIAEGVLQQEGELAKRDKELADTSAALKLLELGSRREDVEAEQARLARLREEMNHLRQQREQETISCPVQGIVTTPRLNEKIGTYLERGTVICVVEDLVNLEAEIAVSEQDARVLVPGQSVTLKPRALPYSNIKGKVDRVAPAALLKEAARQSTVTVYCRVDNEEGSLRTGMTGFGRIDYGLRPLGWIWLNSTLRLLRTEFWW